MTDFKIGDKVRIKKLSKEEFKEIYFKYSYIDYKYKLYLKEEYKCFNKYGIILDIHQLLQRTIYKIKFENDNYGLFFKEKLIKISYLKTKFKIINKLLEN